MIQDKYLIATVLMGLSTLAPPAISQTTTPTTPAPTTYNNASLKGDYVLTEYGVAGPGGVLAAVATLTADGTGGVKGSMNVRWPGQTYLSAATTGVYQINQDGTGNITLQFALPAGDVSRRYAVVFTKRGLLGATSDGGVFSRIELEARPTAPTGGYNFAAVAGSYGYSEAGVRNGNAARVAIGDFSLDPTGAVTGVMEERTAGLAPQSYSFAGTYTIAPDGSGVISIRRPDSVGGSETEVETRFNFAVGKDSKLSAVRVDPGLISVGQFERQ